MLFFQENKNVIKTLSSVMFFSLVILAEGANEARREGCDLASGVTSVLINGAIGGFLGFLSGLITAGPPGAFVGLGIGSAQGLVYTAIDCSGYKIDKPIHKFEF